MVNSKNQVVKRIRSPNALSAIIGWSFKCKKTLKTSGIEHKIIRIDGSSLERNDLNKNIVCVLIVYQENASI